MKKTLPLFVGLRYVRSKQREGFFSLVSGFSFGAMALGVTALIVVLSVMNGFDREIKTRILNVVPHVTIEQRQEQGRWSAIVPALEAVPGVDSAAPFVEGQGMLSGGGELQGVSLQGIDPRASANLGPLRQHMLAGDIDRLAAGEFGVVLGSLLARSLGAMTGDTVLLTLPDVTITPVGVFPRSKRLRVVGIYRTGAQVDTGIAIVHMDDARKLLRMGEDIHGVRLTVRDPFAVARVLPALEAEVPGGARVRTWESSFASLFQAIRMEKTVVGLLLAVIIAVAAFNIVASLVLMVADKRRDIAVLRTMGATGPTVAAIFRVQGAAVGVGGVLFGVALGCLVAWQLGEIVGLAERLFGFRIFDPEVYFISRLPTDLQWLDVVLIAAMGALISLLATLYPARRAGLVSPAEVLRYDR